MELHSPVSSVVAKRLWNFVRIIFFMMRKGLISKRKRKLVMDMNLMMKMRGKLLRKTLGNILMFHSRNVTRGGFGIQEYEFSCSNSPKSNPLFFHLSSAKRKHQYYFPCINPQEEPEEPKAVIHDHDHVLPKIQDYSPECPYNFRFDTPGDKRSPFSVRVSNYSSDDEINDHDHDHDHDHGGIINRQVDYDAEEFITRFYEQLRVQSRTEEMLARGTR